jgi:hypothetical protein
MQNNIRKPRIQARIALNDNADKLYYQHPITSETKNDPPFSEVAGSLLFLAFSNFKL